MASAVEYTTIQQQIESLQGKGLLFDNKAHAELVLERYGYYNIINSYKEPYQNVVENHKKYIVGTTFEQIYSMFTLDHNCQTAHCGRHKPCFDFGGNTYPIVPYRHLPQTLSGFTADCRSPV